MGFTFNPIVMLDNIAAVIDPKAQDVFKIGVKILFVFFSIIVTWVKTHGACIPIPIPKNE